MRRRHYFILEYTNQSIPIGKAIALMNIMIRLKQRVVYVVSSNSMRVRHQNIHSNDHASSIVNSHLVHRHQIVRHQAEVRSSTFRSMRTFSASP